MFYLSIRVVMMMIDLSVYWRSVRPMSGPVNPAKVHLHKVYKRFKIECSFGGMFSQHNTLS